jgi:hypothetical protein
MKSPKPKIKERPFDNEPTSKRREGEVFKTFLDQHKISLAIAQFKSRAMIDLGFFEHNLDVEIFQDEAARRLVAELTLRVASKKFDSRTVIYPANWWESFKKRWAPSWFLKRYPVRHDQITFEANAYYPDIAIPDHAAYVDIVTRVKDRMYS